MSPGKVSLDDVSDSGDSSESSIKDKSPSNQGVVMGDNGNAAGDFCSSAYENDECSLFGDDCSVEEVDDRPDYRRISAVEVKPVAKSTVEDSKPAAKPTLDVDSKPVGYTASEFLAFAGLTRRNKPEPPEAVVMDESKPPAV
jgi:hypothetical protein